MSSTELVPLPKAVVVAREKDYAVMIGQHELGVSKAQCDAALHANILNRVILDVYKRGCEDTRHVLILELKNLHTGL